MEIKNGTTNNSTNNSSNSNDAVELAEEAHASTLLILLGGRACGFKSANG